MATTMQRIYRKRTGELRELEGILTASTAMNTFFAHLEKAARSDASVLIRGETGTGKELAARALHKLSRRRIHSFEALNCAALTGEMMASELFGHVKGAYTGAFRDRTGLLRSAHRGTIFFDEVAEMPLNIQARLLRVLQTRSFIPLGGSQRVDVDIRLLSATNDSLRTAVEERRFREDLMYRLRVIPIYIPPLRDRGEDVELLIWHFIDEFSAKEGEFLIDGICDKAHQALMDYHWPGNIRELRNVVEYAVVMADSPLLKLANLPPELRGEGPEPRGQDGSKTERERIIDVLKSTDYHRGKAADILGMNRSTLWRKMRELKIRSA